MFVLALSIDNHTAGGVLYYCLLPSIYYMSTSGCSVCSLSVISVLLRGSTDRGKQQKYRQYTQGIVKLILPLGNTQEASQLVPILLPPWRYCHCRKREEMSECQGNHANVIQHGIMALGPRNHLLWPKTTTKGVPGESLLSLCKLQQTWVWGFHSNAARNLNLSTPPEQFSLFDHDSFIYPRISRTFPF